MGKYSYILFDLDGTLDDPFEGITRSVEYAMKKFDVSCERETLKCFIGPPLMDSFMSYFGLSQADARLAVDYYREYYRPKGIFEVTIYEGIPELLRKLVESGYQLILATSKPIIFADMILDKFDLKKYFSATFGSELDGTRTKKDEVIEYAFASYPMDRSRAIMVGDRRHDVEGAHKCGIPCVGVTFGYGDRAEHIACGADFIAEDITELEAILNA